MNKLELGAVTLEICDDREDCWDYVKVKIGNFHVCDIVTTDPSGLMMTQPGKFTKLGEKDAQESSKEETGETFEKVGEAKR